MSDSSADVDEIRGRRVSHASLLDAFWSEPIDVGLTSWVDLAGISGIMSFEILRAVGSKQASWRRATLFHD